MMKISDKDACNRNGKLSSSPSLITSTYCHYFHTLQIPLQELAFSYKPGASHNFYPGFSIFIYYSCPSSPIWLEKILPYGPIKIGSITLLLHFGIRAQQKPNNPKDSYTNAKRDMWTKCLTAVHQSYMVRCFPCTLDFGQGNVFYGISAFFNNDFCLAYPGDISTSPGEFHFFIFPCWNLSI